jgi:hypothetical protein
VHRSTRPDRDRDRDGLAAGQDRDYSVELKGPLLTAETPPMIRPFEEVHLGMSPSNSGRFPGVAALAIASILLASCTAATPMPSGAMALRTDENLVPSSVSGVLCGLNGTLPQVSGVLEGDPSDEAWPVWIQTATGRRMYVVWPKGFSVRFNPTATLLDQEGTPILHDGSPLTLGQFSDDPATGTRDHPFVAVGAWSTGLGNVWRCYTYPP